MFQREINGGVYTCPDCGSKLVRERDQLHCEKHGAFFAYGPQLLVRVPRDSIHPPDVLLPWEDPRTRSAQ
jgi:hypothetical protein